MPELLIVVVGAAGASNLLLDGLFGLDGACASSRSFEAAATFGLATALVIVAAAVPLWILREALLAPLALQALTLPVAVFTIAAVVRLLRLALVWRPALQDRYRACEPLLLVNTAVLGAVLLALEDRRGMPSAAVAVLASAAGFAAVMVLLGALRERVDRGAIPAPFRGLPITLVTLALMALAFAGFGTSTT